MSDPVFKTTLYLKKEHFANDRLREMASKLDNKKYEADEKALVVTAKYTHLEKLMYYCTWKCQQEMLDLYSHLTDEYRFVESSINFELELLALKDLMQLLAPKRTTPLIPFERARLFGEINHIESYGYLSEYVKYALFSSPDIYHGENEELEIFV